MNKNPQGNTPVMKQFLDIKSKYKDTIILFRMGDFYETFLDDAVITSKGSRNCSYKKSKW